jgi:hypothetical protein
MRAGGGALAAGVVAALLVAACSAEPPAPAPTLVAAPPTTSTTRGTGCPPTSVSGGPVTSQVVVVTTSPTSAAAGSVLAVKTEIVVLSDAPAVVTRPQWSALEVLAPGAVVARAVGVAGTDIPTPITRGTTIPAPTVPTQITLTGCDGKPLAAGSYRLRALVGYRSGSDSAYAMVSEPVDLTIT